MIRPDCTECGEPLAKPFTSCRCGWRAVPTKKDGNPYKFGMKVGDHWVNKGCAWNDHGVPCEKYGPLSTSTNGEGPWYCQDHFADLMGWPRLSAARTVAATGEVE